MSSSGKLPRQPDSATPSGDALAHAESIGVQVSDLGEPTEVRAGLSLRWGAVVHGVDAAGRAARAGLLPADIVLALNGRPIRDARHFVRAVEGCDGTRELVLAVMRRQDITTVHVPSSLRFEARPGVETAARVCDN